MGSHFSLIQHHPNENCITWPKIPRPHRRVSTSIDFISLHVCVCQGLVGLRVRTCTTTIYIYAAIAHTSYPIIQCRCTVDTTNKCIHTSCNDASFHIILFDTHIKNNEHSSAWGYNACWLSMFIMYTTLAIVATAQPNGICDYASGIEFRFAQSGL